MLDVAQLSRKYGDYLAVDNVSFSIQKGEIVGLLGHNGAGKTTIMKMISGYLEANSGNVSVDGLNLQTDAKLVQRHLGYLPESLPVYPEMSVADYLDFAADLKGLDDKEKKHEIARVINATDISEKLLAPISTLSRGYKQRVGVAQAILGQPKLLILDEPTNGLDPEQTQHMRTLIKEIANDATVILSTHIMQEVDALCSRVLMLHGGNLAVDAELSSLRQSNQLRLETSLTPEAVEFILNIEGIDSIEYISERDQAHSYRIHLKSKADRKHLSAKLAQSVIEQNGALYQLHPELRDLETLFKEVSDGKFKYEVAQHAA